MTGLAPRTRLRRTEPAPPRRIVHLGLGAFSRSHTAWYTDAAADRAQWGISAYTGRSHGLADRLGEQDGLFTLIERDADGDHGQVIESVVAAHPGDDVAALVADIADPDTAVITLTITEAGYRLTPTDAPDLADPVVSDDTGILRAVARGELALERAQPHSALARLLLGLEARRRAGAGPVAIVSCDNLSDNGGRTRRGMLAWAALVDPTWAATVRDGASFVSSSVDRITPRIDDDETAALSAQFDDLAPVVAEPFHDWVLSGDFPAGRPAWETAGARFVDEIGPWEERKLWLLNGAHTILACLGMLRGHETVASAIADPECGAAVEAFWDEAQRHLPAALEIDAYRAALLARFANPRIVHRLSQIAEGTEMKVRLRIAPIAERERAAGRSASGCVTALAAWVAAGRAGLIPGASPGSFAEAGDCLRLVSRPLRDDSDLVDRLCGLAEAVGSTSV